MECIESNRIKRDCIFCRVKLTQSATLGKIVFCIDLARSTYPLVNNMWDKPFSNTLQASWCLIWLPHQLTATITIMIMISHWHFLSTRYPLTKRLEHVKVPDKVWMHYQIHSSHLKTFNSRQLHLSVYCHKRPQDVCKFLFKVKKRQKVKESLSFRIAMGIYIFFTSFTVVDFDGRFCCF